MNASLPFFAFLLFCFVFNSLASWEVAGVVDAKLVSIGGPIGGPSMLAFLHTRLPTYMYVAQHTKEENFGQMHCGCGRAQLELHS